MKIYSLFARQIICCFLIVKCWIVVDCSLNSKRLLRYLFQREGQHKFSSVELPVKNDSEPLNVRMRLDLNQILDLDEKNQIIVTTLWLELRWFDYKLTWNPAKFGNISEIHVPQDKIWLPDILLYNSANDIFTSTNKIHVTISHNGLIKFSSPGLFSSTCRLQIRHFPFDTQLCSLKFGSWSYFGNLINLSLLCKDDENMTNHGPCSVNGEADVNKFSPSAEWVLKSWKLQRNVEKYACCDFPFIDITLHIKIQRKSFYYLFNFLLPCATLSVIACLSFLVPPDAGEKISLCVTILLSLSVFLMMLSETMPQSSLATPLLAIYFIICMVISAVSLIITIYVLIGHHNDQQVNFFIRVIINKHLARLLFLRHPTSPLEAKASIKAKRLSRCQHQQHFADQHTQLLIRHFLSAHDHHQVEAAEKLQQHHHPQQHTQQHHQHQQQQAEQRQILNRLAGNRKKPEIIRLDELQSARTQTAFHHRVTPLQEAADSRKTVDSGMRPCSNLSVPVHQHRPAKNVSILDERGVGGHFSDEGKKTVSARPLNHEHCEVNRVVDNVVQELEFMTKLISDEKKESKIDKEWKFAAHVIDRFCLIIFSLSALGSTVHVLLQSPHDDS